MFDVSHPAAMEDRIRISLSGRTWISLSLRGRTLFFV